MFLLLFRKGVNLKGDRNIENRNLGQLLAKSDHGSFYFISLHNFFYVHASKLYDKDNWGSLRQVIRQIHLGFTFLVRRCATH
jgi:hypothetical protein